MPFASGVSLRGTYDERDVLTLNISGTIVDPTDLGKAVSQDTSAANTVKLAADGETIIGELKTYQKRIIEGNNTGGVLYRGACYFKYTGTAPAVGQSVVGAGSGLVKAAAASVHNQVFEVDTTNTMVVVLLR